MRCLKCQSNTNNPKFCSRTCSTSYNNTIHPRRHLEGKCKVCRASISSSLVYCSALCREGDRETPQTKTEITRRYRAVVKQKAVALKGGGCMICGYNRCISALEFHHLNPAEKDFQISRTNPIAWNRIVEELKKCILLCCRCHREIHEGIITWDIGVA